MGDIEGLSRCGGRPEPLSRLAISRTSGCAGNSANSLHLEKGASLLVVHSFRASSFLSRLDSGLRMSEGERRRETDKPSGKPLFFGRPGRRRGQPVFPTLPHFPLLRFRRRHRRWFPRDQVRFCTSCCSNRVSQRLQKPAGCSSPGGENAWRGPSYERNEQRRYIDL